MVDHGGLKGHGDYGGSWRIERAAGRQGGRAAWFIIVLLKESQENLNQRPESL